MCTAYNSLNWTGLAKEVGQVSVAREKRVVREVMGAMTGREGDKKSKCHVSVIHVERQKFDVSLKMYTLDISLQCIFHSK